MKQITIELPEDLANRLEVLSPEALAETIELGLRAQARSKLEDYLSYMQTDDILAATHRAKEESWALLADQGLTAIALAVSDALADLVHHERFIVQPTPEMAIS